MDEMSLAEAMRQVSDDGAEAEAAGRVNPVAVTIQTYRRKTSWLNDGTIEWEAKRLHAESSFEPWKQVPEDEKELWYHLARVKLLG